MMSAVVDNEAISVGNIDQSKSNYNNQNKLSMAFFNYNCNVAHLRKLF